MIWNINPENCGDSYIVEEISIDEEFTDVYSCNGEEHKNHLLNKDQLHRYGEHRQVWWKFYESS